MQLRSLGWWALEFLYQVRTILAHPLTVHTPILEQQVNIMAATHNTEMFSRHPTTIVLITTVVSTRSRESGKSSRNCSPAARRLQQLIMRRRNIVTIAKIAKHNRIRQTRQT